MSRVVYLYSSMSAEGDAPPKFKEEKFYASHPLITSFHTEGFYYLWKILVERKVIDEVLVVVDSAHGKGVHWWFDNYYAKVIPHLNGLERWGILRPDDIIFARGGFRPWPPFLQRANESKKWVLFYRAASNRLKWPYWDVVIEDLTARSYNFGDRLHYRFNKPISPEIFTFTPKEDRVYDVMFHASHIHDKKGQWKGVEAALAYRKKYGKDLHAIMPGGFYGGGKTRDMYQTIRNHHLDIKVPGMVQRTDLCRLMNQSKLYLHLGVAGQNDRGNLESMRCGCQQIIGNPQFHAPFIYSNWEMSVAIQDHSPEKVADVIHHMLEEWTPEAPAKVHEYYERENGTEVAVSQMTCLLEWIKSHPVPDRSEILKRFVSEPIL